MRGASAARKVVEAELGGARGRAAAARAARGAVSPKRFVSCRRRCASNAKTATSISAMTFRRSAVASSAPSRCWRSVSVSALTSIRTSPSASSGRAPRARIEKSPSRIAARRFETVWSGRTTRSRSAAREERATTTATSSRERPPDLAA